MFDGLTCSTPAALRIGIEIADEPELNAPIIAIALSSWATLRALRDARSGVHDPTRRGASLSETYRTGRPAACPPARSSARRAPRTMSVVCDRAAPCSGRLE